jgi:hypothetical protein
LLVQCVDETSAEVYPAGFSWRIGKSPQSACGVKPIKMQDLTIKTWDWLVVEPYHTYPSEKKDVA